jgi:hypothetical protein
MNAVEHVVGCYFRLCRQCFNMNDVKVIGGNIIRCVPLSAPPYRYDSKQDHRTMSFVEDEFNRL